ncbi:hypothetical protein AB0D86_43820 [Streptomyces sp. NPDC048324]|uniref:hypothetical protein n=1 Tax=Streptomyces sp. NPDC048324 TaxID=3157205 RepID=UPI0034226E80
MFRKKQTTPPPSTPQPEVIAIDLAELAALEKALLEADRLRRSWMDSPTYYGPRLLTVHDAIAMLYQRAGAASAVQPDPQRARIPLYRHEITWLTDAIVKMERHWARGGALSDARLLHNRFNALLGHSRAVVHMGGTPVFTPDSPQDPQARVIALHRWEGVNTEEAGA